MENEKKYLLPALKEDMDITFSRCWEKINAPYDFLIQNLKLSYESVDSIFDGKSSSMPHVFEQMLLFQRAFLDEKNPDHRRAVLEWKAVLAIMALPRICNFRLKLTKVDLSDIGNPFLSAAAGFFPTDPPVFDQMTRDFLYVLQLEETAIALFSPTTVVCPAKEFKQRIGGLDWIGIEKVNGQEELLLQFKGPKTQRVDLAAWLKRLQSVLIPANRAAEIVEKANYINGLLEEFISELAVDGDQAAEALMYEEFYSAIKRSRRREYEFLNFCCDFTLPDQSMSFLVERYLEDIFQDELIVVVYNRSADSITRPSHIPRLDALFSSVVELNGRSVIAVSADGGERIAACALIPFKKSFVEELISHRLAPEKLMEDYSAVYRRDLDAIEITLQIRGFPYSCYKRFTRKSWRFLYGTDLAPVRLWPTEELKENDWNAYYIYAADTRAGTVWSIPLEENCTSFYPNPSANPSFRISFCQIFPSYLCCTSGPNSGYLPIQPAAQGTGQAGGKAMILLDIGHATTAIKLLRFPNSLSEPPEELHFMAPRSTQTAGGNNSVLQGQENFITPRQTAQPVAVSSFKNIIRTFRGSHPNSKGMGARPFEDGVVLFELPKQLSQLRGPLITFLNFEYKKMDQDERRIAHNFIEQILLYAAHTAALYRCSYLQVGFLHGYPEDDHRLGELEEIFNNALDRVKYWTGLRRSREDSVHHMRESEALVYRLYRELTDASGQEKNQKTLYAAADIGWQKTTVAVILNASQNEASAKYTQLEFAGRDISLLNGEKRLECYPEMLNILLCGREKIDPTHEESVLLEEFRRYCSDSGTGLQTFYQGLFDVIAQKIDEAHYIVPPDVYNRMEEFYALLQMVTYNMLLLFFNIGYQLGNFSPEFSDGGTIHLCLCGNGEKLLNWICNQKDSPCIDSENVNKTFILKLDHNIISAVKEGYKLARGDGVKDVSVSIYPLENGKEQLLEGFALKEQPMLYGTKHSPPQFDITQEENLLAPAHREGFFTALDALRSSVFGDDVSRTAGGTDSPAHNQIDEFLRTESQGTCDAIIQKINQM